VCEAARARTSRRGRGPRRAGAAGELPGERARGRGAQESRQESGARGHRATREGRAVGGTVPRGRARGDSRGRAGKKKGEGGGRGREGEGRGAHLGDPIPAITVTKT
jgi:hypothetical protein